MRLRCSAPYEVTPALQFLPEEPSLFHISLLLAHDSMQSYLNPLDPAMRYSQSVLLPNPSLFAVSVSVQALVSSALYANYSLKLLSVDRIQLSLARNGLLETRRLHGVKATVRLAVVYLIVLASSLQKKPPKSLLH